jgi:hypothetical protein
MHQAVRVLLPDISKAAVRAIFVISYYYPSTAFMRQFDNTWLRFQASYPANARLIQLRNQKGGLHATLLGNQCRRRGSLVCVCVCVYSLKRSSYAPAAKQD